MEDRIIIGNKKSRITSFNIDPSIDNVPDLISALNGGVYNDSLPNNATTGNDVGVAKVGTPLDKENILPITIATYTHTKSGSVHYLTGEGPNIVSKATASYTYGETFNVNGVSCTAQTATGEPLDGGAFISGAVIFCIRSGNVLNFKSGGTSLGYRVLCQTSQPVSPRESDIWIESSMNMQAHMMFSESPPTNHARVGRAYITIGPASSTSPYGLNNVIKSSNITLSGVSTPKTQISFYLGLVYVCTSAGVWTRVNAYIRNGGVWNQFSTVAPPTPSNIVIYDNGPVAAYPFTFTPVTGGSQSVNTSADTYLQVQTRSSGSSAGAATLMSTNLINVNNFSALRITAFRQVASGGNTTMQVGLANTKNINPFTPSAWKAYTTVVGDSLSVYTIDLSNVTTNWYIGFSIGESVTTNTGYGSVTKIELVV